MGSDSAGGTWSKAHSLIPDGEGVIVNLGCGNLRFEHSKYRVYNVDLRGNCDENWDLNWDYPWGDGQFQGAVAVEVLEHLENHRHFLRETFRVTEKWVILTFPNVSSEKGKRWYAEDRFKIGHIGVPCLPLLKPYIESLKWGIEKIEFNNREKEIVVVLVKRFEYQSLNFLWRKRG